MTEQRRERGWEREKGETVERERAEKLEGWVRLKRDQREKQSKKEIIRNMKSSRTK